LELIKKRKKKIVIGGGKLWADGDKLRIKMPSAP
jgi:hypothetical protein